MKKNFRVIQINGFRGLLIAFFTISCLVAGFVAFPALLTMTAWNYLSVTTSSFPVINFGEGILLWAIVAFSVFIFNKKKFIVSFNAQEELSEEEVRSVVAKFKAQNLAHGTLQDVQLPILKSPIETELGVEKLDDKKEAVAENKEN